MVRISDRVYASRIASLKAMREDIRVSTQSIATGSDTKEKVCKACNSILQNRISDYCPACRWLKKGEKILVRKALDAGLPPHPPRSIAPVLTPEECIEKTRQYNRERRKRHRMQKM